jgi:hypothetical protein
MCDVLLRPKIYRPALTHDLTAVKEGVALPVMIKFYCQKYLWMVENITNPGACDGYLLHKILLEQEMF